MNSEILSTPKVNLFEKKYLASRIACLAFIITIIIDLVNSQSSSSGINWIYAEIVFLLLFVVQFIFQFKILNGALGGLLFIGSLYMVLALFSEYNEFPTPNKEAYLLLTVGLSLCISGIVCSILVIRSLVRDF